MTPSYDIPVFVASDPVVRENTDRAVIKWLEDNFGGSTREVKGVRKRKWQWVIRCRDAWRFLLLVRPYLKIKDAQARIAIAFQEKKVNLRGKADVADLEMKCREAFACRLSEANRGLIENRVKR